MLRNYVLVALRALRRSPGYTVINVVGLAVGLACSLLIFLYVQDERSYDRFHEDADRTYRVLREFDIPDLHTTITTTPAALAPTLAQEVPAVDAAVRVSTSSPVVQRDAHKRVESGFLWADEGFFEVFSFPLVEGTAALDRPGTVVLTEQKAAEYFPNTSPIGQTLRVDDHTLDVTGVMAVVPSNAHLRFDFVGSLQTRPPEPGWGINNYLTYVRLAEGHDPAQVAAQVDGVVLANTASGDGAADETFRSFIPHLQPITGIHLGQGVDVAVASRGNILYVYLFIALAVFIVLLACINFMNLATARSAERAREVGVRKALGAQRAQLAVQFLSESLLLSALALVVALALCHLTVPLLNQLAGKTLTFDALYGGPQILVLLALVLAVGLLAGSYPALVLSQFKPVRVLKDGATGTGRDRLRRGLVVFQFAISIALVVSTGVVLEQLRYMKSTGLGFEASHLVLIEQAGYLEGRTETLEQELEKLPGVQQATVGFSMPGTFFINSMWQPVEAGAEAERQNLNYSFVGFDYVETLGIELAAGRSFSRTRATDSTAVILNEAAARDFGWTPDEALGKKIGQGGDYQFTVIGVANDFHYESLHAEIYPLALFAPFRTPRYLAARIAPEHTAGTVEAMRRTWQQFSDLPFTYSFLADDLAAQYRTEDRLGSVFAVFAGLAILIACLGLLGLAAFSAARRTKEIGIRKVLGASVASIVALFSKDFLLLVLTAFAVAAPVAYVAMHHWLSGFAYRIDLSVGVFVLAGALTVLIALLTVSYQAIKAALADPVHSLRYE